MHHTMHVLDAPGHWFLLCNIRPYFYKCNANAADIGICRKIIEHVAWLASPEQMAEYLKHFRLEMDSTCLYYKN